MLVSGAADIEVDGPAAALPTGADLDDDHDVATGTEAGREELAVVRDDVERLFCIALINACALALAAATCAWMVFSPDPPTAFREAGPGVVDGGPPRRSMVVREASARGFFGGVPFGASAPKPSSSSLPNTLRIGRLGGIVVKTTQSFNVGRQVLIVQQTITNECSHTNLQSSSRQRPNLTRS